MQWRTFYKFCENYKIHEWPVTTNTLCLFAQHLSKKFRSVKSIESYLYGVVKLHLYADIMPPNLKDFKIKITLLGLKRRLKHKIQQARPLTPKLLLLIKRFLTPSNTRHVVFWAILLTGFYLLLRKSNLVPNTRHSFDSKKHLSTKQVKITKNFVQITIYWSKTIQFHQRKLTQKMYALNRSQLCPVKAFNDLFSKLRHKTQGPCFVCSDGKLYSYNMLQHDLRKYLKLGGVKRFYRFSAHSLRRGGLTWGFKAGLSKKYLKSLGDWRSDCFERYLSFPKEVRNNASKIIRNSLLKI